VTHRATFTFAYAVFALSTLGACAGELDQPQRFAAAVQKYTGGGGGGGSGASAVPPACVLQVFKVSCGLAACHARGAAQIDLVSNGVTGRLLAQESRSAICKGRIYMATDGTSSLLLDKLTGSPPCGARMPLGGMISPTDAQCLAAWVSSFGGAELDAGEAP
jgi:hypothetical protein